MNFPFSFNSGLSLQLLHSCICSERYKNVRVLLRASWNFDAWCQKYSCMFLGFNAKKSAEYTYCIGCLPATEPKVQMCQQHFGNLQHFWPESITKQQWSQPPRGDTKIKMKMDVIIQSMQVKYRRTDDWMSHWCSEACMHVSTWWMRAQRRSNGLAV